MTPTIIQPRTCCAGVQCSVYRVVVRHRVVVGEVHGVGVGEGGGVGRRGVRRVDRRHVMSLRLRHATGSGSGDLLLLDVQLLLDPAVRQLPRPAAVGGAVLASDPLEAGVNVVADVSIIL